jgi:hypothetical protein
LNLPVDNIDYGTYDIFVKVAYMTGSSDMTSTITLRPESIKKMTAEVPKTPFKFNWWIILLLIFIIFLIYRWFRK